MSYQNDIQTIYDVIKQIGNKHGYHYTINAAKGVIDATLINKKKHHDIPISKIKIKLSESVCDENEYTLSVMPMELHQGGNLITDDYTSDKLGDIFNEIYQEMNKHIKLDLTSKIFV